MSLWKYTKLSLICFCVLINLLYVTHQLFPPFIHFKYFRRSSDTNSTTTSRKWCPEEEVTGNSYGVESESSDDVCSSLESSVLKDIEKGNNIISRKL